MPQLKLYVSPFYLFYVSLIIIVPYSNLDIIAALIGTYSAMVTAGVQFEALVSTSTGIVPAFGTPVIAASQSDVSAAVGGSFTVADSSEPIADVLVLGGSVESVVHPRVSADGLVGDDKRGSSGADDSFLDLFPLDFFDDL